MKEWWKTAEAVAEELGWRTGDSTPDGDDWIFQKYSPKSQDCVIEVGCAETKEELVEQIEFFVSNFDVSENTYLWLDNHGHGKYGAPYDMRELYEDMEWFKNEAEELAKQMRRFLIEEAQDDEEI